MSVIVYILFLKRSDSFKLSREITTSSKFPLRLRCHPSNLNLGGTYSGSDIEIFYSKRPLEVWQRLVDIGGPIAGWWIARKFDNITSPFRTAEEQSDRINQRAMDLKASIVQGRSVTFIKSGQALALRGDIIKSPEYIRELTKLQDEVGTFDNTVAMDIIQSELGFPADELFYFESPEPIASASIGQVYKVRLKTNNQSAALKVQRPDALESASLDMYILRKLAAYLKKRYKLRSDLVGVADVSYQTKHSHYFP